MRQSQNLTLEEFGKRMGYSKGMMSRYLSGERPKLTSRLVREAVKAFGVSAEWLKEGKGNPHVADGTKLNETPPVYKVREEMKIGQIKSLKKERGEVAFVPVVSWASAGKAHDFQEMRDFIDEEMRSMEAKNPQCFALRVEGDSMEPRYLAGDLVVLDPNREARNGNRVVARLKESEGVLFKVYNVAGDDVTLVSYNQMYPPLKFKRKDFLWIYPVIETNRKEPT